MEEKKVNVYTQETIEDVLKIAAKNVINSDFLTENGEKPDPMVYMMMGMTGAIYLGEYRREIKKLLGIKKEDK